MSQDLRGRRSVLPGFRRGFPLAAAVLAVIAMAVFYAALIADTRLISLARFLAFLPVLLSSYRRQDWRPGAVYAAFFSLAFVWQANWAAVAGDPYADVAGAATASFLLFGLSLVAHGMAASRGAREKLADTARERGELLERTTSLDQVAWFVCQEAMQELAAEDAGLLVQNPVDERWELFTRGVVLPATATSPGSGLRLPGWLAGREREIVIDDLQTDGRFEGRGGSRSLLARPLRGASGQMSGLLVLTHSLPGAFGPEDFTRLTLLASAAETALEHASAYERAGWASEHLARQLAALQRTARELNTELEPEAIAGRTLDCAMEITGARAGAVLIEIEGIHPLIRSTGGGFSEHARQRLGEIAQKTRPILEEDCEDGLLVPSPERRLLMPIHRDSRPFGALVIESVTPGALNGHDVQAIASLASHAAVALENTRLFRQIKSEREKSHQIVQNMADGVLTLDGERRVTSLNPAAERLLGSTQDGAIGRSLCELIDCEAAGCPDACSRLQRLLEGEQETDVNWRPRCSEQARKVLKLSVGRLLVPEGGAVVLLHDATREQELAQFQRDLLATFSHELRSPLANISALAEVALDDGGTRPPSRELMEMLRVQSQRLANLSQRTLNVERLEAGAWPLEERPLAIAVLVREAVRRWERAAPARSFTLDASDKGLWVWGDEDAVGLILDNLLDNAVKYTRPGTAITVAVERSREGLVTVAVEDRGDTIPAMDRARLFERFYRREQHDARRTYGFGFGLYIVRQLAVSMAGDAWMEPADGGGNRFAFSLRSMEGADEDPHRGG